MLLAAVTAAVSGAEPDRWLFSLLPALFVFLAAVRLRQLDASGLHPSSAWHRVALLIDAAAPAWALLQLGWIALPLVAWSLAAIGARRHPQALLGSTAAPEEMPNSPLDVPAAVAPAPVADAAPVATASVEGPATATWPVRLQAPLRGIVAVADLLGGTRLAPEQRDLLRTLRDSAASLLLQGIEPPSIVPPVAQPRTVKLPELVRRWREWLQAQAALHGLQLELDATPVEASLSVDAGLLTQLLQVQAERAFAAAPAGSRLVVQLRTESSAGTRVARLRLGWSQSAAFAEEDPWGRALREALGAEFAADSASSWLEVPVESMAVQECATRGRGARVIAFDDPLVRHRARVRPMRLLLVQPSSAPSRMLQQLLERAGHVVTRADDIQVAIDAIAAGQFELAVVDGHLPAPGTLAALKQARRLRAHGVWPAIVVLCAEGVGNARNEYIAAGAMRCLTQPVATQELLEAVALVGGARPGETAPAPQGDDFRLPSRPDVLRELAQMNLGEHFLRDFVEQCLIDARECLSEVERCGSASRWGDLREAARSLRGIAQHLGGESLAADCLQLMRDAEPALRRDWRWRAGRLQAALELTLIAARAEVARLEAKSSRGMRPGAGA